MESTNHEKTGSLPKALILSGSPHRNGAVAGALELVRERIAGYYDCELARAYELSVQPLPWLHGLPAGQAVRAARG